jgi:hypothetical protein
MDDEEENINPEGFPIFKTGKEIFEVLNQLCKLIPDNNSSLLQISEYMISDAAILAGFTTRT